MSHPKFLHLRFKLDNISELFIPYFFGSTAISHVECTRSFQLYEVHSCQRDKKFIERMKGFDHKECPKAFP